MGLITDIFKPGASVFLKRMFHIGRSRFVGHLSLSSTSQYYLRQVPIINNTLDVLWNKGDLKHFHTNVLTFSNLSHSIHQQPRNHQIKAQLVLLIDSEGGKIGTMPLPEALNKAKENSLHVVQIQHQKGASPAICKLVSSRMLYESEKKAKHSAQGSKVKELKITGRIAPQDLQWKSKKIYDFLEHGYIVKLSITRKPYQKISISEKLEIVKQVEEQVKDVGILDGEPKQLGALALKCNFKPAVHKDKPKPS